MRRLFPFPFSRVLVFFSFLVLRLLEYPIHFHCILLEVEAREDGQSTSPCSGESRRSKVRASAVVAWCRVSGLARHDGEGDLTERPVDDNELEYADWVLRLYQLSLPQHALRAVYGSRT